MNSVILYKNVSAVLMAVGSFILLHMLYTFGLEKLFDLLDTIQAKRGFKNETQAARYIKRASSFSGGLNTSGIGFPLTVFFFGAAVMFFLREDRNITLPVGLLIIWCVYWACVSNTKYHMRYNADILLLVKEFFANFVTVQNNKEALARVFKDMKSGSVKNSVKRCYGLVSNGVDWGTAVKIFANNTFSGHAAATYLNLYQNFPDEVSEEITSAFTRGLEDEGSLMRHVSEKVRSAVNMNLILKLLISGISVYLFIIGKDTAFANGIIYAVIIASVCSDLLTRNLIIKRSLL